MRRQDALGRSIEVEAPPARIVSLVPSLTEALFAFGVGERVVGVTYFCVEPREEVRHKTRVGGTKTLDVPRVLALRPDLVIASAEENRREDVEALLAAGLRVFVTLPTTVREAVEMLRDVAALVGAEREAEPIIARAEEALAETVDIVSRRGRVRVFCPIWRGPWMSVGPGTYMNDLLSVCGGDNIFADSAARYPEVTLEEVVERDPQVVLLPSEPYRFRHRHLPEIEALPVSAVRDGRVHLVDGRLLCWYGPRIPEGLTQVRRLLVGE